MTISVRGVIFGSRLPRYGVNFARRFTIKGTRPTPNKRAKPGVSNAIRQSARGEECTLKSAVCNHDPATTVFCHIRLPGDGMGMKPPDYFGFYGCSACHAVQEARDYTTGAFGFEDLLIALRRTQERLHRKGLLSFGV